jgi:hypothetical protein
MNRTISEAAIAIGDKVEAFVRATVAPYEQTKPV